jgi:hypothetical protein
MKQTTNTQKRRKQANQKQYCRKIKSTKGKALYAENVDNWV